MNSNPSSVGLNESIMRQIVFKFFPYWPIFLILLILSLSVVYVYLQIARPIYSASATILIKDEKKGAEDPKMIESFNYFSSNKILENEIEVIHSRALLTEVVKELNLCAPVYEKQKFRYISAYRYTSAYLNSPVTINVGSIVNSDSINRNSKVPFSYIFANKLVKINGRTYRINEWVSTPYGILRFSENVRKIKDTYNLLYFSLIDINEAVANLSSQISVTPSGKLSTVIRLEMEDEVPQRANDILNALAKSYSNSLIRDKNKMAENTLQFIEERIRVVKKDLDSLERTIQMFKARQGIVDLGAQGQQFIQNVGSNDQKIADINMQLAVLNQVEKYVVSKDNKAGIVPSTLGVMDPVLTNLLEKLHTAETEYEKLKRLTAENNPMLLSVAGQIEQLRPGILENIGNQRRSLEASKSNINTTNSTYSTALSSIPQKEKLLLELTRQQSIISNVYTFLLQKREETGLSFSSNIANNIIIDSAASSINPVKPKRIMFYAVAIILVIGGGIAFVMGREQFSGRILYRSEIEKLTSFPVIAEIAYDKTRKSLVIAEGKKGLIQEQFRKLRASLSYIGMSSDRKKILITSTISGEGKSFVAANLGLTLAIAGKKVILLELDLSNPSLSEKLNVHEEKGMTSFLRGESNPEEVIKRIAENNNLFIIPSGDLPDNPSELMMNGKLEELFAYLKGKYDYIIVDTAPVSALSDAYILSPLCDSTLYLVRHNYTPKAGLQRLEANNKINELKNVMIVFNSLKPRGFIKTDYGYGYTFNYPKNINAKRKKLLENTKS